jgi:hypothetical protein
MFGLQSPVMNVRPGQAGVIPLQTPQQTGFDINSIMNMMMMMMVMIMPMQMMGGMFSSEKKEEKKAIPAAGNTLTKK